MGYWKFFYCWIYCKKNSEIFTVNFIENKFGKYFRKSEKNFFDLKKKRSQGRSKCYLFSSKIRNDLSLDFDILITTSHIWAIFFPFFFFYVFYISYFSNNNNNSSASLYLIYPTLTRNLIYFLVIKYFWKIVCCFLGSDIFY